MLMNILDVRTRECPADPLELDERFRVTRRGRRGPGGGNLYADLPTIAAMVRLSRVSGDDRYRQFAGASANYTMTELVDDKGFFWWGWHRHYDAHRDVMTGHAGNHHEIHIQQVDWPLLWEVNSPAVRREIEAIWQWHVIDKRTGEVNRHGDGQRGCDFAMSAGEMIAAFAFLHTKTDDTRWLDRAKLLAGYYWERRNKQTNLIANRPNAGKDRFDGSHFDTSITGFHCRGLLDAHEYTGEPLFCDYALAYLRAYAKLGYDADAGKYWGCLKLDGTPEPGPRVVGGYAQYEPRGHIDLWQPYAAGYEHPIHTAQIYARAHKMTGDKAMLPAAQVCVKYPGQVAVRHDGDQRGLGAAIEQPFGKIALPKRSFGTATSTVPTRSSRGRCRCSCAGWCARRCGRSTRRRTRCRRRRTAGR